MAYDVVFAADAIRDFTLIFDFLADSRVAFGEDVQTAIQRASSPSAKRLLVWERSRIAARVTMISFPGCGM